MVKQIKKLGGKRAVSFEIQRRIQQWVNEEDRWNQLCEYGTIYKICEVSSQIGIEKGALLSGLKDGVLVTGGRNRLQHLYFIPPDYVGSDCESTTRTCLATWLNAKNYKTYGSSGLEVSFKERGLKAIARLAETKKASDFVNLRNHLTRNGIDLVAFSEQKGEILLIELKGWTRTCSDFNETIHQIFKRILEFYTYCGIMPNVKFACAFPHFRPVPEWQKKYNALKFIPLDSLYLYYFSSATKVKKINGRNFFKHFLEGAKGHLEER